MKENIIFNCPVEVTINVIGGRWKPLILSRIGESTIRFNELHKLIPKISQKVLSKQLKELEKAGIIKRTATNGTLYKVEYCLTDLGKTVIPIKSAMCSWGSMYAELNHIIIQNLPIPGNNVSE